jgi:hypothetical protein
MDLARGYEEYAFIADLYDHVVPYRTRPDVDFFLARSGFAVEQLYADYDKSPYGAKYPGELIFVAKKSSA